MNLDFVLPVDYSFGIQAVRHILVKVQINGYSLNTCSIAPTIDVQLFNRVGAVYMDVEYEI